MDIALRAATASSQRRTNQSVTLVIRRSCSLARTLRNSYCCTVLVGVQLHG
jgi:hypothetical protein